MGLFDSIKTKIGFFNPKQDDVEYYGAYSWIPSINGLSIAVNKETALTISAVYNAINIISNDIAVLPKGVYQKTSNGRESKSEHPVHYLISRKPNSLMTAFNFHRIMQLSILLHGNAAAIIRRDRLGRVESLEYVGKDFIIYKKNNELYYEINDEIYHSSEILHLKGYTTDGVIGFGVIEHAAASLGVTLNAQKFSADYYATKAQGFGIVESDKHINYESKKKIEDALSKAMTSANMWRIPVLDDGMKFKQIRLTAEEIKFIDQFKFSVEEVARWFNVPPHKLKQLDGSSYNAIENMELQHIKDSLLPYVTQFEQEYETKLFSRKEIAEGYYIKFNMNVLLRADLKSKAEYYSKMVFNGIYTRNEVRALEELNSLDGLSEPLTPVNAQTFEQFDKRLEKNIKK